MLIIKTDLINTEWLEYIIDEFKRINLVKFDVQIISYKDTRKFENTIFYLSTPILNELTIFNSNEIIPNNEIEYIEDEIFLLNDTISSGFTINYDLLWNAFVFLSRYEEYLSEERDKKIYSYSLNHPRKDKNSFDLPIVNILFNKLENLIKEKFINLEFGSCLKPIIELSHDVDYIEKTIQLRLKQTVFNSFNTIKSINKPKKFIDNLLKTFKFAFSNPSYWCFDYWQQLENKYNKKSIFYIYVKDSKKDLKSWLIDPSYDIKKNTKLQNKLKELYNNGFEIGLHGSYNSANNFEVLEREKKILENCLDIKISKTRQHWLNYEEVITPFSHEKLFKFDSSLAWNDRIGFRSGCASLYRPYNFKDKKAFEYYIIPQVIMDSNIYDYTNDKEIFNNAKKMIRIAKLITKQTHISVSWHQRVSNSDYNWHYFYEELLDEVY